MKNITQFLLMLTLSIYIAFAPAAAYADINDIHQANLDKIKDLEIELQKRVGDRWTLSPRNKSVGAGVEIGVSQNYPVAVRQTATTVGGAVSTSEATVTAEKIGSKIFTPTTANIAKRFAGGVATNLVAIALYDMLGKAVDYVMDPANNRVKYKIDSPDGLYWQWSGAGPSPKPDYIAATPAEACQIIAPLYNVTYHHYVLSSSKVFATCHTSNGYNYNSVAAVKSPPIDAYKTFDELAQRSQAIANNPNHKDVATAQSGMQTIVGDMITKNEIDNSYFNDSSIQSDTYNDVTNNYITNNYNFSDDTTNSTIVNPNGSTTTKQHNNVSNPDGTRTSVSTATTTNITQNSDGSTITKSTVTTTSYTYDNSGNIVNVSKNTVDKPPVVTPYTTTNPDGSTTTNITNVDGSKSSTTINTDGSKLTTTINTDGSSNTTIYNSDGSTKSTVNTTKNTDGSTSTSTTINNNDGTSNTTTIITNKDGSVKTNTTTNNDGTSTTTTTTNNTDGISKTTTTTKPDGTTDTKTNFELPAFCDWAKPVCDFIEWVKTDPEPPTDDNSPFVKEDNDPPFDISSYANAPYVQFSGECPAPPVFNIFGGQIVFPMDIICKGCEQMSWVFVAFASLRAFMIVFFGSKD